MYSVTNAISAHCNRNAHSTESVPYTVAKVALAIFVTLGVGAATFSAIFFTSHLLIPSLATSVSIVVLLGGADVCVTICCKNRNTEAVINFLGDQPSDDQPAGIYPNDTSQILASSSASIPVQLLDQPDKSISDAEDSQIESNPVPIQAPKVQETPEEIELRMKLMESVISNVDLFYEIMKFLNFKEICKFTRVCKEWNVWINNENAVLWKYLAQNENYTFLPSNLISKRKQLFLLSSINAAKTFSNGQMLVATRFLFGNPNHPQYNELLKKIGFQAEGNENEDIEKLKTKSKIIKKAESLEKSPMNPLWGSNHCTFKNYRVSYQFHVDIGYVGEILRLSDNTNFYFKALNIGSHFYVYNDKLIYIEDKCIKFYNIVSKETSEHPLSENFKISSYFEDKIVLVNSDSKINKLYIFDIDAKTLTFINESSCTANENIFINNSFLILFQDTKPSSMPTVKIWQYESTKNMTIQKITKIKLPIKLHPISLNNNFLYLVKIVNRIIYYLVIDLNNFKTVGEDKIEIIKESEEVK